MELPEDRFQEVNALFGTGLWSLQIINDRRYPDISAEILDAMRLTFSSATARGRPSWAGQSDVLHIADPAIARAFPQHGPGRKHTRPIVLADWQRALTHAHPAAPIRGLIHSDGCRCANRFQTTLPGGRVADYSYVRYFFTNHSADIRGIFVEHCGLLGIRVTRSKPAQPLGVPSLERRHPRGDRGAKR